MKRKCFVCRHITCNCRNMENRREERLILMPSNKFEVLSSRVMNMGISSRGEVRKNRKKISREEKLKERKKEEKK